MHPQASELEQRLVHLETHIDRLNLTLQQWRDAQDHVQPMERRLSHLTDQCADILKQWATTGERYAHAVGELESRLTGWNEIETRLQRDASWRFQALERTIENEWASLRRLHEEPARQLREQAESLTEICVTTAGSAQTGLERAEARLAALETELHRRMGELSRDVQTAIGELRHRTGGPALRGAAAPWPLEDVTRLHQELRESGAIRTTFESGGDAVVADHPLSIAPRLASSVIDATAPAAHEPAAIDPDPTESTSDADRAAAAASRRQFDVKWYAAVAVLAVGFLTAAAIALIFYRQADTAAARAAEARQDAERAAAAATQRIETARQDAAQQIAQARDTVSKAQVTTDVLAAPDLVRFNLTSGDTKGARSSAQLLWSRSRGMVFSASRLPTPPPGGTYQIWLLTAGAPVSAGTVVPDASGRVTAATDTPPAVPQPIVGVRVTLEQTPGGAAPSGSVVLARAQ